MIHNLTHTKLRIVYLIYKFTRKKKEIKPIESNKLPLVFEMI